MKQRKREIPSPVQRQALQTDVSLANQRRYFRSLKNGGRAYVIGRRLALRAGRVQRKGD
jgi:hypothetical protein